MDGSSSGPSPSSPAGFGPMWLPGIVRRNLPALVLVALAIAYPEFLTGSTRVLTFLVDPVAALFLLGLYGAGVLWIREVTLRSGRGWPTILLLGAAYGVLEEGVGTKTFFDAGLVGTAGAYGHAFGVNWLWVAGLTAFHAVFSIALPILTVELLFPAVRGRRLTTDRGLAYLLAAYAATVGLMFLLFDRAYPAPPRALGVALAGALAAVAVAMQLPRRFPLLEARGPSPAPPSRPFLLGCLFVWGQFGITWLGPLTHLPVELLILPLAALYAACGLYAVPRLGGPGREGSRARFLLGSLSFLFVLATVLGVYGDYLVLPVVAGLVGMGLYLARRWPDPARGRPSAGEGRAAAPA